MSNIIGISTENTITDKIDFHYVYFPLDFKNKYRQASTFTNYTYICKVRSIQKYRKALK